MGGYRDSTVCAESARNAVAPLTESHLSFRYADYGISFRFHAALIPESHSSFSSRGGGIRFPDLAARCWNVLPASGGSLPECDSGLRPQARANATMRHLWRQSWLRYPAEMQRLMPAAVNLVLNSGEHNLRDGRNPRPSAAGFSYCATAIDVVKTHKWRSHNGLPEPRLQHVR